MMRLVASLAGFISLSLSLSALTLTSAAGGTPDEIGIKIPRACVAPHDKYEFCDPSKAMDERVASLVSMLTNVEKATLLIARESPKGNVSRLGIPEYDWGGNCIHGVQSRCGTGTDGKERCPTSYPNPNFLGASFNRTVWKQLGSTIGVELRSLWLQNVGENHPPTELPHIGLDCWSPNIGIVRDTRWGRNLETPGEDPFLNGQFGAEYTTGLQTSQTDKRFVQAVVTLKHFDANSLEGNWPGPGSDKKYPGSGCPGQVCTRHTVDPNISDYDLASTYLPAFRTSVEDGNALGVMCSYNSINGKPSCANSFLLQDQLRTKWGFQGYVTSDSGAIADISNSHFYTPDLESACVAAVTNGCDMESAGWPAGKPWATDGPYEKYLPGAVTKGTLAQKALDAAATHTLGLRFRLGLFDPIDDQPMWHVSPDEVRSESHLRSAEESTDQGWVLLKNPDSMLPFDNQKSTAVIGPLSNSRSFIVGNYLGQICPGLSGSGHENFDCVQNLAEGIGNETSVPPTVIQALSSVTSTDTGGFADAVAAAKSAQQVIMFLGNDGTVEGEGHDRHNVTLPGAQQELFDQVYAANENVVVVLFNGGAIAVDKIKASNAALVEGWYPGFFGATSLARTLFGKSNRWGKLPITIYSEADASGFDMLDFSMSKAPGRTYRYFTGEPLFSFGFGLSYTTFKIVHENAALFPATLTLGGASQTVSINVTNVGKVKGDEVIMAHFRPEAGTVPEGEPAQHIQHQLFDFKRVSLAPGMSTVVTFTIDIQTLQLFDRDGNGVLYAGDFSLIFTNGVEETAVARVAVKTPGKKVTVLDRFR